MTTTTKTSLLALAATYSLACRASSEPFCASVPDGTACDDGNPCTVSDRCVAGRCVRGQYVADVITRVSVSSEGVEGDGPTWAVAVSANGRFVAFSSSATNLVPGDTNRTEDVFVHDLATGRTEHVSVGMDPSISADGRYVAFGSFERLVNGDNNAFEDVFVRDRERGITTIASIGLAGASGNHASYSSVISADGRALAFTSQASNLVPGDTNGVSDIFVRDLVRAETERISVGRDGTQSNGWSFVPSVMADGTKVAFYSQATNLVADDLNGTGDLFVRDRPTGTTRRVSLGSAGEADGNAGLASVSADGRLVAFESEAANLVPGDTNGVMDVFVRDVASGTTERVSVREDGTEGASPSEIPAISGDGRFVAFSTASALALNDTNEDTDVYVHDRATGELARVSAAAGREPDGRSYVLPVSMSADGRVVGFISEATNLVPGDTNGVPDAYAAVRCR